MQLELRESAASIRERLLIKCGFYARLYGIQKMYKYDDQMKKC